MNKLRSYLETAPESTFQNMKREEAIAAYESMVMTIRHLRSEIEGLRVALNGETEKLRHEVELTVRTDYARRIARMADELAEGVNDEVWV